jgi:hypothetical protein
MLNKRILTVALLAMCLIGFSASEVSAKQHDYYWTFHEGDKLTLWEYLVCAGTIHYYTFLNDYSIDLPSYDGLWFFRRFGKEFLSNYSESYSMGFPHTEAIGFCKAGDYVYKEDEWYWLDPNYYHVKVIPKVLDFTWFLVRGTTYQVSDLPGYNSYAKFLIASQLEKTWYITVNEHDDSDNIKSFTVLYGMSSAYDCSFKANYTDGRYDRSDDIYNIRFVY